MTWTMLLEHLVLVLSALSLAILLGIPLGLLAYLYPKARTLILRTVDLIQTTPALALLGIIMVFMGAGKPTVMVGLALYSLLPIVRNTYLGLSQVPGHLKEAATAMGMGRSYQLVHVELPLAMPILFTGVRIALVNAIGTAVFAAFVGGGGIGKIIYTGIRQQNIRDILLGTGSLMALALALDGLMALAEHRLNHPSPKKASLPIRAAAGAALAAVCAFSVWLVFVPSSSSGQLRLYDGGYSEVQLMHNMFKQVVEDRTDLTVNIIDQMSQVNNYKQLLGSSPSCDLMFSYDGTVLTTFLKQDVSSIPAGTTLYNYVSQEISRAEGLQLMGRVGLNNTYAIGVTPDTEARYGVKTISDLVPIADQLRFGGEHEFFTAEGSMKFQPFVQRYGLSFRSVIPVDVALKYTAAQQDSFDVMVVFATDGLNKRAGLTILEDDLGFFPEYYGAFLVREALFQELGDSGEQLKDVLDLFTGLVSTQDMIDLTYQVDVDRQPVEQVAHQFLVEKGILD